MNRSQNPEVIFHLNSFQLLLCCAYMGARVYVKTFILRV